jgi:uncharacterized phiE125 gp8 family phage protein
MSLVQTTPPALEPLTLNEVTTHLRLDSSNVELAPGAPTAALAGDGVGLVDDGAHRYRLTFLTLDGETEGGTISAAVVVADKSVNGQVALTELPLGGSNVLARKLYRTMAGGADFFLLATIADNETTSYQDNIADAGLGVGCPTQNTTADPALIGLMVAAREVAEVWLNRTLITTQWRLTLDYFPRWPLDVIWLPRPNLISVESITYRNWIGAVQTLDVAVYSVDTASLPGRITRNYAQIFPPTLPQHNAVTVDFTAGYGATRDKIPQAIKQGMLLFIGELYENPESLNIGNIVNELPALKRLWYPYRFQEIH